MNEFSFQNKIYDLLLNLAEDNYKRKLPSVNSVKELRLMIDMIKSQYPLYENADDATIAEFIKDIFNVIPSTMSMNKANHIEDEHYRPVECFEILPGITYKMVGFHIEYPNKRKAHFYYHTFPTHDMSIKEYAHQFDIIWKKSQAGEAFIKNTYKFRKGDKIFHKDDPKSIGIIKDRIPAGKPMPLTNPYYFEPNSYMVTWLNIGTNTEVPLRSWYNEDLLKLIQTKKLEATPMKTFNIKKRLVTIKYEFFSPKEWLEEKVKQGYDKTVHITLLQKNTEAREFGWITKQKKIEVGKDTLNTLNTIKNKLKHKYHIKLNDVRNLDIIDDTNIVLPKKYTVKKHKVDIISTPRQQTYQVKLTPKEIEEYKFLNGKNPQNYTRIKHTTPKEKLVCVKYILSGENGIKTVTRIPISKAKELVENHANYEYANKKEWREYCDAVKNTRKKGLTTMGIEPVSGMAMPRRSRRYNPNKHNKGSRLVKEQIVPKIIPEQEIEVNSINPTIHIYDENGNITGKERLHYKYIKPAHIVLKRIFTRIKAWKPVKVTEDILLERKVQSEKDKAKYLVNKHKKSLNELKEIFASDERRGNKYSEREGWSKHFKRLVTLITTGNKYTDEGKTIYINKKGMFPMVSNIINLDAKFHWDNIKILDFIRYIRQTTHGIFNSDKKEKVKRPINSKKLAKIKKPTKQVEFEPAIIIPVIDVSKLKHNLPEEGKQVIVLFTTKNTLVETEGEGIFKENNIIHESGDIICSINTVTKWKYPDETEFKDILIDEGGGVRHVPIKFKRKKSNE